MIQEGASGSRDPLKRPDRSYSFLPPLSVTTSVKDDAWSPRDPHPKLFYSSDIPLSLSRDKGSIAPPTRPFQGLVFVVVVNRAR